MGWQLIASALLYYKTNWTRKITNNHALEKKPDRQVLTRKKSQEKNTFGN